MVGFAPNQREPSRRLKYAWAMGWRLGLVASSLFAVSVGCGDGNLPLSSICEDHCPYSPREMAEEVCAPGVVMYGWSTDCGGKAAYVRGASQAEGSTWYFDADGKLTGATSHDYQGVPRIYGEICPTVGLPTALCSVYDSNLGCGHTALDCEPDADCPASLDAALTAQCSDATARRSVKTTSTTCGGTLLQVVPADGARRYCFNADGELIGIASFDAHGGEQLTGLDCDASSAVRAACPPP